MDPISLLGSIAALLTTAAFVPQAYKTIRERSTEDLSFLTFSMLLVGTICWCVYGVYIGNMPLILANSVTAALTGMIWSLKLRDLYIQRTRKRAAGTRVQ